MPRVAGSSTLKNLPEYDSYVNVYLNGGTYPTSSGTTELTSWYSTNISSSLQSKLVTHLWNIGPASDEKIYTLAQNIEQETAYKWSGKVGLMTATEFVRDSTNPACTNLYSYARVNLVNNEICFQYSSTHNWLSQIGANRWTISPYSDPYTDYVFNATSNSTIGLSQTNEQKSASPVFYLSSDIRLKGQGTEGSPYYIAAD